MGWFMKLKSTASKIMTVVRIYDIINPKARVGVKIDEAVAKAEEALKPHLEKLQQAEAKLDAMRQLYDLVFLEQTPANTKPPEVYTNVDEVIDRLKVIATESGFYVQHISGYLGSPAALERANFEELQTRFAELTKS